jgi:DNA-binding IclR family transcriptional regulator
LSGAAVKLAGFLCNRAVNDHGVADGYSCQVLARQLGFSRATLHRALAELQQAGFLVVQSGRKARRINRYTLTFPLEGNSVVIPFSDLVTQADRRTLSGKGRAV